MAEKNTNKCMPCRIFGKANHGKAMVPALDRMVSFRVVKPDLKANVPKQLGSSAPTLLNGLGASSAQKTCINWNVDLDHAQKCLHGTEESIDKVARALEAVTPKTPGSLQQQLSHQESASEIALHAQYEHEDCVEYFSATQRRWMNGIVRLKFACQDDERCPALVSHNVTLYCGSQYRPNVDLDLLRTPLLAGEPVELVSWEKDGQRLPAVIAPGKSPSPCLLGYRVVVEGSGKTFDHVAPHKLRRRFPRNHRVEVYRGPERGWEPARVHDSASRDGCNAELVTMFSTTSPSLDLHSSKEASNNEGCSCVALWTLIPVCTQAEAETENPELVPSYLVRRSSSCTAEI